MALLFLPPIEYPVVKYHPPINTTHGKIPTMADSKYGAQRAQFESNKKKILASQSMCAICGRPVDKSLKFPDPWCATVDHIIPWNKGGDCSIENLQLAHMKCNRMKSDKIFVEKTKEQIKSIGNNQLPLSADWATF